MNFKLTLTLAVVFLLVAIGIIIAKRSGLAEPTTPSTNPSGATALFAKKPDGLKSITYLRDGVVQVKFDKDADNWMMSDPAKAPVDPMTLNSIASSLTNLNYLRKFEPEAAGDKSPESTGTAKPHNLVKFTDAAGVEHTLAIGFRANDASSAAYATLDGGKTIYVLESNPVPQLDKDDANDFRNKSIKQVNTDKIVKLEVKNEKGAVTLSKIDGKWQVTAPVSSRANPAVVDDIVSQFKDIQALKFSPLKKSQAGVDPGIVAVTAWVDDSPAGDTSAPATTAASQSQPAPKLTAVTLQLGYSTNLQLKDTSPVYASLADSDGVFTLNHDNYNKMNKELKDLRDAAVVPAAVRQTTGLTLTTDNAPTLTLASKGQDWTLSTASDAPPLAGDPFAISEYLGVIADLRAIKFVDGAGDLKSLALDPPHMKIDLTIPGQTQHEVLLVGKPQDALEGGKMTPVMRQGEPTVYLVQSSDGDKLAASAIALRDKTVARLNADKIRKIEISGPLATIGVGLNAPLPTPATAPAPATTAATSTAPASAPATGPALPQTPGITFLKDGLHWNIDKAGTTLVPDDSKITSLLSDFTPLTALKYVDDKPLAGTPDLTVTISVLESAFVPATTTAPATAPATGTAPATAPATASAPATAASTAPATAKLTLADVLPTNNAAGPDAGKLVTYTLKLYRQAAPATAPATASAPATAPATQPAVTWKVVWDNQSPAWTFQPNSFLVDHLAKEIYTPTPPATAPATTPAPAFQP